MPVKIVLYKSAENFKNNNPSILGNIDVALNDISKNPFVDDETKFFYSVPPCVITLYKKDNLWILYHLNDACTQVDVWNIGKQGDKRKIR